MAYILCAIVMYGFWWHKPFGVEHVTVLPVPETAPPVRLADVQFPWQRKAEFTSTALEDYIVAEWVRDKERIFKQAMFYSFATVFSAIHVAAWNWDFCSPIVRDLWRAFSVATTAAGPLLIVLTSAWVFCRSMYWDHRFVDYAFRGLSFGLFGLYCASRLGLVVLVFYSFSEMPAGVYQTVDWTSYIPNLS